LWHPGRGQFWPQGHNLNNFGRGPLDDAIYLIWKLWALLFQTRRFLKIAFWKPIFWPRDLHMQPTGTCLNNFGRGPPRDPSCEVWSKYNEWFQRRSCLKKLLMHGRTDGRTMDDGRQTMGHHKSSPWALCAQVN